MNLYSLQRFLDHPLKIGIVNRWAHQRWIRRGAILIARTGNFSTSVFLWFLMALCFPPWGGWGCLAAGLGFVSYKIIKGLTARPRPFESHEHIVAWDLAPDRHSFPSGHAVNATIMGLTLALVAAPLGWVGAGWLFLTGLSRVILGLHYPSDVVAGVGLGVLVSLAVLGTAGLV